MKFWLRQIERTPILVRSAANQGNMRKSTPVALVSRGETRAFEIEKEQKCIFQHETGAQKHLKRYKTLFFRVSEELKTKNVTRQP